MPTGDLSKTGTEAVSFPQTIRFQSFIFSGTSVIAGEKLTFEALSPKQQETAQASMGERLGATFMVVVVKPEDFTVERLPHIGDGLYLCNVGDRFSIDYFGGRLGFSADVEVEFNGKDFTVLS